MYGIIAKSKEFELCLTYYSTISFHTIPSLHYPFHIKYDYSLSVHKCNKGGYYGGTFMGSVLKAGDLTCSTINTVTWQHATCYKFLATRVL